MTDENVIRDCLMQRNVAGLGFELEGAVVDSNGHIVLGEESVGIALTENGRARVDAEGDDLNV